tara:strand:- start:74 stop:964 length:891 start_codon:yes stop_codon:yes gene_type:complete
MAGVRPKHKRVSDIKSTILSPSLTPEFEVQVPVPSFMRELQNGTRSPYNYLSILCTEASLPGNNLITFNVDNDFTGVTEKMPHRKVYDSKLDLTFYVNANSGSGSDDYYPIKFFETYISYIAGEDMTADGDSPIGLRDPNYHYRMSYPDSDVNGNTQNGYRQDGLYIYKFEKSGGMNPDRIAKSGLTYEFLRTYPVNITSMPITYGDAQVLKCTVSYSYVRYILNQKYNTSRVRRAADRSSGIEIENQYSPEEVAAMNTPNRILRGQGNQNILTNPNRGGGGKRKWDGSWFRNLGK